jgi:hypothetical protein
MKKQIAIVLFSSVLFACGGDVEQTEPVIENVEKNIETTERAGKAQMVFQTVPSPLETASIFQNAGANYNADLLNPIENVENYSTNTQKALNFGVYGADLSYANIFDQTQETMFYMNCSKKLADALGVTAAFDAATMERLEENMNNRDSLMIIINDAFWIADAFLKENGQDNLSALIIVGGWVEGLYIGSKTLDEKNPDEALMKKIADQKFSLDNLVELLSTYDADDVKNVAQKLEGLKTIYDKISEEDAETTVENNAGVTTIGGGSSLSYEKGTIIEISNEIEKIRNEIIQ